MMQRFSLLLLGILVRTSLAQGPGPDLTIAGPVIRNFTTTTTTTSATIESTTKVLSKDEFVSDCPAPNGFFADASQCDKYYECVDNQITEKLCPDGMAFNDLNPRLEKCEFLHQVDCQTRPDLQRALGAPDCPRANGHFPDPDPDKCNVYRFCYDGTASTITCPESLVFSPKIGACTWPDQSGRSDCNDKTVLNFTCPSESKDIANAHPRYADPEDCQYFYVCISGVTPRHHGCKFGEVFNSNTTACDIPKNVPECEQFYFDYFDEYFATLGAGSTRASTEVIQAALDSNYPVPENAKIHLEKPRINSKNRRRRPTKASAPAVQADPERTVAEAPSLAAPATFKRPAAPATIAAPRRPVDPVASQRPVAAPQPQGTRRRRPIRRRKTTTTTTSTTTEPPPPEYYYDYYYDDDYVYEDEPAPTQPESNYYEDDYVNEDEPATAQPESNTSNFLNP